MKMRSDSFWLAIFSISFSALPALAATTTTAPPVQITIGGGGLPTPGLPLPGAGSVIGPYYSANGQPLISIVLASDPVHRLYYVDTIPVGPGGQTGPAQAQVLYAPPGQNALTYNLPAPQPYFGPQAAPQMPRGGGPGGYAGPGWTAGPQMGPAENYGDEMLDNSAFTTPPVIPGPPRTSVIPKGANDAIEDIEDAWKDGPGTLFQVHLGQGYPVQIYENGQYQRTVSAEEYLRMVWRPITTPSTENFVLDHQTLLPNGVVRAWGQHFYFDENHRRQSAYIGYWFRKVGARWIIVAVNTAASQAKVLIAHTPGL